MTNSLPAPNEASHTSTLEQCMGQCELWAGPALNSFEYPGADSYTDYTTPNTRKTMARKTMSRKTVARKTMARKTTRPVHP